MNNDQYEMLAIVDEQLTLVLLMINILMLILTINNMINNINMVKW